MSIILNATVPAHTLTARKRVADMTVPAHTLVASVTAGFGAALNKAVPAHRLSANVVSGNVVTVEAEVPAHTLASHRGPSVVLAVPAHSLVATVLHGNVVTVDRRVPVHTLSARAHGDSLISTNAVVPSHQLFARVLSGNVATLDRTVKGHRLSAHVLSGNVATASLVVPAHELAAHAYGEYIARLVATVPAHQLRATVRSAVAANYRTWVMNLRNKALTEYEGFEFVSLVVVDGRVYAAGPDGIFELGAQATDAGDKINATVRTGKHDFGTGYTKRVPRAYLGHEADGDLEFYTITGADGRRGYLLAHNGNDNLQMRRVPIGRGPKSTYWQYELKNRHGSGFMLDKLQLYPELTKRRYQG